MCLPVYQWCPALQMSLFTCLPSVVSQCARGARLCGCLSELVCLAVSGSPDVYTCLPSFFAGCLSFLVSLHVTPSVLVVPGSLGVSPNLCAEWCPALRVSLFTCLPSCLPRCLVVSGSLDVFCVFSLVSHHVSLAMCLPIYPSANFIILSPIIGLPLWWCPPLSSVRLCVCLPSFVSHLLSRTSFVSEATCLQSYVCLSGGVLF